MAKLRCKRCRSEYEGDPSAFWVCDDCFEALDEMPPDSYLPTEEEIEAYE